MEGIVAYRQLIKDILLPMERWKHEPQNVRLVAILDDERNRFVLARTGWMNGVDVYSLLIHLEIQGDEVVLYQDNTDQEIYEQLLEGGVPQDKIVQAWLSPSS